MDIYEAAAYYDFIICTDRDSVSFPRRLLIIDTDKYSVGFCECLENGNYHKICEYVLPNGNNCLTDINKLFSQKIKEKDIFYIFEKHLDTFNKIMKNYYRSDGHMDTSFKESIGLEINCSDIEIIFKATEDRLNKLFSSLDEYWYNSGFKEEDTNIMMVGKCADLFPIRYFVKSYFSFDPFLADERYVNDIYSDKPSQIYEVGKKLFNEKRKRAEEIFVSVYDRIEGKSMKQKLSLSNNKETEEINYFGPIFVSVDEGLEFEVNSEKKTIILPYSVEPLDCDVVDVGLQIRNDIFIISIRRFYYPTKIYEIPIK